jgi:hypothetical protein
MRLFGDIIIPTNPIFCCTADMGAVDIVKRCSALDPSALTIVEIGSIMNFSMKSSDFQREW